MKKLFISQPMNEKTEEEILTERENAIELASDILGEQVEVLDTYFQKEMDHPLEYLGESIKHLAKADIAYFAEGWDKARGCKIEHECAVSYGIRCITDDEDVIELSNIEVQ